MTEIKDFLREVFELEKKTIELKNIKEKFDEYNSLAKELKSYLVDSEISFGLPILRRLKPARFYNRQPESVNIRDVFKISRYSDNEYKSLWLVYTSIENPKKRDSVLMIDNIIVVGRIKDELKIVSLFFKDYDTDKWAHGGGISIDLEKLGEPLEVERILSPKADQESIDEYNANR